MTTRSRGARAGLASVLVTAFAAASVVAVSSAAQAAPLAPVISAAATDITGSVSVSVDVEDGIEQTVTVWAEFVETGVVTEGCVFTDTVDRDCVATLPAGQYGDYELFATSTDVDGTSPESNRVTVSYGSPASDLSLASPFDLDAFTIPTLSAEVTGTGPALGTVEVFAYRVDVGIGSETSLCFSGVPASGAFSCTVPFGDYGVWAVRVVATDLEGGTAERPGGEPDAIAVNVAPPQNGLSIATAPGSLTATATGLTETDVSVSFIVDWFGAGSLGERCPAGWTGDYEVPPTDGPSVVCLVESVPPGIHLFSSVQFINETYSSDRGDAVYVPATPTMTVEPVPGGAIFSGSIDLLAEELVESSTLLDYVEVVVRDSESTFACSAVADAVTGQWSCTTPLAPGGEVYTAVAQSVGFSDDPGVLGQVVDYWDGISTASAPVAATISPGVVPPPPTMTYEFGAASVGVTAEGLEGSRVGVEVYDVEPDGEGGYSFGFPVASCGDAPEGEGGGGFEPESAPLSPATVEECVFDDLEPGIWNFYAVQSYYFEQSEYQDDFVLIPEVPTFSAAPGSNGRVLASGEGETGFRVLVRELGGPGACSAIVDTEGAWSCSFSGASGRTLVRAQQQSQGFVADPGFYYEGLGDSFDGFSAYTAPVEVVVAGPAASPAPIPTPTPAVTPAPFSWTLEGFDGQNLRPGQQLSLSARGLPPGTSVTIQIFSTPRTLGTSVADASGLFALDVVVPEDLEPGEHTLVATATPPGGTPSQISTPVMVDPALDPAGEPLEESVDDGAEENAGSGEGAGGASGSIARDDPAAPSELTEAIPTAAEIFRNPIVTVTAGGLALAILLLVAFPTELLNSTLSANTRRFGRGFAAFERGVDRVTDWFAAVTRTRAAAAAILIVVTSVIFGFMDPSFGFDAVSLRLTLALAIGLFLVTYVSSWISGAIIWRAWRIETSIGLQPAALVFALIGVVIARLLEFSPGFLIGLVIGLEIVTRVGAPHRVRAVLTQLGVMVGISVLAWVGYSILTDATAGDLDWVTALALDSLAAATAEGLTAAAVAILPLGFLEGREIFQRSKVLWVGAFLVTATLFSLLVLPTEDGIDEISNVGTWFVVLVAFAVVTLALWAVLHYTNPDRHADDDGAEPEGAEPGGAQKETAPR